MSNLVLYDDVNFDKFRSLYQSANKKRPNPEDVRSLKVFLDSHPDLVTDSLSMTTMVLEDLIENVFEKESEKTLMRSNISTMKKEFGYSHASVIEKMLFDTILVSWVRLQYLEGKYNQLFKVGMSDVEARFYNQCLSAANLRFTRASETLGRLKKFHINFQVNIAAEGGQQVNTQKND
jgi:hypothetical protein